MGVGDIGTQAERIWREALSTDLSFPLLWSSLPDDMDGLCRHGGHSYCRGMTDTAWPLGLWDQQETLDKY